MNKNDLKYNIIKNNLKYNIINNNLKYNIIKDNLKYNITKYKKISIIKEELINNNINDLFKKHDLYKLNRFTFNIIFEIHNL